MRLRSVRLMKFKRFDDLTIDLGPDPRKIVVLVGPNGCGKSSVFDAFEESLKNFRQHGQPEKPDFFSKSFFYDQAELRSTEYDRTKAIQITTVGPPLTRKSFYIRTAYRYTAKLNIERLEKLPEMMNGQDEPTSSIALDRRLETNYKRLLGLAYSEFSTGTKTGSQVREELLGRINSVLSKILDVELTGLGNIVEGQGQLYFSKGNTRDFPYANLSAGEKEVIDIVLDILVKTKEYDSTVFCIDEPELHLNTAVQRRLLVEIEKLVPDSCQLWVATHSIGFLRAVQEELGGKSQVLDFSQDDYFSGAKIVSPMRPTRQNWLRIFRTALDDLVHLIAPRQIVYCEGKHLSGPGNSEKGLDAQVLNAIFSETYPDTVFVSSGGNTELDQRSEIAIKILYKVFDDLEILVLKDRDMASGRITTDVDRRRYLENNPNNHRVLDRWEIENYLLDKTVLKKYCLREGLAFDESSYDRFVTDITNQNVKDSISQFRKFCNLITPINPEVFKLKLAQIIVPGMPIYDELEACIFRAHKTA